LCDKDSGEDTGPEGEDSIDPGKERCKPCIASMIWGLGLLEDTEKPLRVRMVAMFCRVREFC
jgi:hypothetical protein